MLKSMSVKQGKKYDSPSSAAEISNFINFHKLNVNEILQPLDSFSEIRLHSNSMTSTDSVHRQKTSTSSSTASSSPMPVQCPVQRILQSPSPALTAG